MAGIEIIEYRGWDRCYKIFNEQCEVIILPAVGGRVLAFSLDGQNIIFENPAFDGKTYEDWQDVRFDPDGGRFDVGPEKDMVKKHDMTWMGAWEVEILGEYQLKIVSKPDTVLGLRTTRIFALDVENAVLFVDQSIENISNTAIDMHFWGRTLVKPGGKLYMPVRFDGRFENGYALFKWNPNYIESTQVNDGRISVMHDVLEFKSQSPVIKGGVDAHEGWMAYALDDLVFVKEFEVNKNEDYSGSDYMTGIFFCNGRFTEMEPCSPTYTLAPGQSEAFREIWKIFKYSGEFNHEHVQLYLQSN